jgi:hypothetical protein
VALRIYGPKPDPDMKVENAKESWDMPYGDRNQVILTLTSSARNTGDEQNGDIQDRQY